MPLFLGVHVSGSYIRNTDCLWFVDVNKFWIASMTFETKNKVKNSDTMWYLM